MRVVAILGLVLTNMILLSNVHASTTDSHALIMVLDGLRPDYVTQEVMPNLHALAQRGVFCEKHHSVFPTVTRVNSSSIATGAYPSAHGLMGNSVYFPEVSDRPMSTADANNLKKIAKAHGGALLTAKSLGEVARDAGEKAMAFSSGSGGSSMLINHSYPEGIVINPEFMAPEDIREEALNFCGTPPEEDTPNIAQHRWVVDCYIKLGLGVHKPKVAYVWFSDPDATAHKFGMGAPETVEALRLVDEQVGRILKAHEDHGLTDKVDIFVTSDHGFSTNEGGANALTPLLAAGLKMNPASKDVVLSDGALYLDKADDEKIAAIVRAYQAQDWVGAIFTRAATPGSPLGFVPGTLSFDCVHWNHPRAGHILIDENWSDAANAQGFKGATRHPGVAGHGTSSPWDIHNTLIAVGPRIKQGVRSGVPSANVDIAPTVCALLGFTQPETMMGRNLTELLLDGPAPESVDVKTDTKETSAEYPGGKYSLTLHLSHVGEYSYVDYTKVERSAAGK